ncbi:MAG: FHA domain-containing protein [Planctomycetes bacterium]|nr:FHA domain-containing protein [Planctomycetota bacterium]NOG53094.1 protein kinase [Planctomycetota bacterium]
MSRMLRVGQKVLGRYRVKEPLVSGGQANLYRGTDHQAGVGVFIKQLKASPHQNGYQEALGRFQREANLNIPSPYAVNPLASGEAGDQHFIIFPWVDGVQLNEYLDLHGGQLPYEQVARIIRCLAECVKVAHRQDISHRDIKPHNILITTDGTPQLIDFGILRDASQQTLAGTDEFIGTLAWMAPEQIRSPGSEDHRADLYSLGAVMYYALTGEPPIKGTKPHEIALSICQDQPVPPHSLDSSIPAFLSDICMQLLAKDRNARMQSAEDLIEALHHGAGQRPRAPLTCSTCGNPLDSRTQFCPVCGARTGHGSLSARCLACGLVANGAKVCPSCGRRFSPVDHRLTFRTGRLSGFVFRIPQGSYSIGRHELADRDECLSRVHMHVICDNGSVLVQDAGSTNKTYVNDRVVNIPTPITAGQPVRLAGNAAIYTHSHQIQKGHP